MYPDLITPYANPDLLARADYDPYQLMPGELPPAPRVFTTAARLTRARQRLAAGSVVDRACYEQLLAGCKLDEPLPALKPADGPPDWGGPLVPWLHLAFYNALAHAVNGDARHRERALAALRLAADAASHVAKWTGHEVHEAQRAAMAYDLLAATGLTPADDNLFRDMLWTFVGALDRGEHRYCNNHNAMNLTGRLSLGAALGHRQVIHDALYGTARSGRWRYGLLHTMRHDFLADGMQWEGVPGYHMLVLMMVAECLTIMENLGVDRWRRGWPALHQDDGFDEHRGWGPRGEKHLTAAIDALIYQAFSNGDYSLLHDQVLGNLRGTGAWWRIFNKAWEVYGDARYAWVLRQLNGGVCASAAGPVPAWFADGQGATEFIRLEARDLPPGEHPLRRDRQFALLGRHERGCSLFPVHGSALLRAAPTDPQGLGAYCYWGPHWAGHRSPAPLHLDLHRHGDRVTAAPHVWQRGYDEPLHLTWLRTTIAHNTVTVDERPAMPFDFETQSLWECDHWRDTLSDGVLGGFAAARDHQALRMSNDNVYPGVVLDRTVLLADGMVCDVFRVSAAKVRQYDWAMHVHGAPARPAGASAVDLGQARGYRHFTDAWRYPARPGWRPLALAGAPTPVHVTLWLGGPGDAQLIVAQDPPVDARRPIGDSVTPRHRHCLLVRRRAAAALFVALWSFDGKAVVAERPRTRADGSVLLAWRHGTTARRWRCPGVGLPERV